MHGKESICGGNTGEEEEVGDNRLLCRLQQETWVKGFYNVYVTHLVELCVS